MRVRQQPYIYSPGQVRSRPVFELEHIGGISCDQTAFHGVSDVRFVDHRAATDIDDPRVPLKSGEEGSIHEMLCRLHQRECDDDDIRFALKYLERDTLHIPPVG